MCIIFLTFSEMLVDTKEIGDFIFKITIINPQLCRSKLGENRWPLVQWYFEKSENKWCEKSLAQG